MSMATSHSQHWAEALSLQRDRNERVGQLLAGQLLVVHTCCHSVVAAVGYDYDGGDYPHNEQSTSDQLAVSGSYRLSIGGSAYANPG
jgi:hypothetical protein